MAQTVQSGPCSGMERSQPSGREIDPHGRAAVIKLALRLGARWGSVALRQYCFVLPTEERSLPSSAGPADGTRLSFSPSIFFFGVLEV